jgi:hypothetical protein
MTAAASVVVVSCRRWKIAAGSGPRAFGERAQQQRRLAGAVRAREPDVLAPAQRHMDIPRQDLLARSKFGCIEAQDHRPGRGHIAGKHAPPERLRSR